jgi:AmmeMemoRadiSam system protein B
LTLGGATLFVVSMMDGRHSSIDIQVEYMRRFGRVLFSDDLDELIEQLDRAYFLHGARFDAHRSNLVRRYRESGRRPSLNGHVPESAHKALGAYFDGLIASHGRDETASSNGLVGLVAPHLDYPRGAPCYGRIYRDLSRRTEATRFVILGTNHFGLGTSVVGTRQDFETPFGPVPVDVDLMRRMDERCGADLCEHEYDHVREHSVELQVFWLRHVLGDRPFTIAPFLCPDPCGPTGIRPRDGCGVDLRAFAEALAAVIEGDESVFVVAGADLSHIGRYFQDDRDLDDATLSAIEESDRRVLDHLTRGDPEAFREAVAATENETSICSVGCIYAAATALQRRSTPRLVHYHQAVTADAENCVTCAAIEFPEL